MVFHFSGEQRSKIQFRPTHVNSDTFTAGYSRGFRGWDGRTKLRTPQTKS
jgi:hypothetical protein